MLRAAIAFLLLFSFAIPRVLIAQNTFPSSGNVGINNTSPKALLDLGPGNGVKQLFYGSGGSLGYYWGAGVNLGQSPNEASIFIGGASGACCGAENFAIVSADQSAWPYTSYTSRLVVNSQTGYTGIGTVSPRGKLDIWGGTMYITGSGLQGTLVGGSATGFAYVGCNTLTNGIAIDPGGNVGIGTTSLGTNKLAVEGTIAARKVLVTVSNPFPDYVFDSTYQLAPLSSLAQYIHQHHHLPEMPSADSVAAGGLDLANNQEALLKKVEELTLYVIQQQQTIEKQAQDIDELKKRIPSTVPSR